MNRRELLRGTLGVAALGFFGWRAALAEVRSEPEHKVWGHWIFDPPLVFNARGTIRVDNDKKQLVVYHADGEGRTLAYNAVPNPIAFAINSLSPYAS